MRPAVLELAAGTDVVEAISAFARRHRLNISVLSGSAAVSNVTLHHPPLPPMFSPSKAASTSSPSLAPSPPPPPPSPVMKPTPSLAISLTSGQGQVIVGTITGKESEKIVKIDW
ncbi:hypothetical protein QJS10_CPA16g00406 [Acorus calamus]|uniref:PPC domain-containing protein n=1 Tax=Acorus calamus TaxID=4465 RepID=A0AAV9D4L8_ACOCL|nr:hypothetical protein QJS10_CPA16g00406 [Acorus calamus]